MMEDQNPDTRLSPRRGSMLGAAILALGLACMLSRVLAKMWFGWFPGWYRPDLGYYDRLTAGDSYYTHGPLVLVVSMGLIYVVLARSSIAAKPQKGVGWLVTGLSLAIYAFGSLVDSNLVRSMGWIASMFGIVTIFWGYPGLRRLWFPILFLVFMIPQQFWLISDMTLALKLLVTQWAVQAVCLLGIAAERSGAQILLAGDKTLVVGSVCSGLRSLVLLTAFGSLFAYLCRLKGIWRVGMFLMTIPVALVTNTLRVIAIIIVAQVWDVPTATGAFHDASGFVALIVSLAMLLGIEVLLLWIAAKLGRPMDARPAFLDPTRRPEAGQFGKLMSQVSGPSAWAIGALGIVLGLSAWWLDRPAPSMWNQHTAACALPDEIVVDGKALASRKIELDESVLTILQTRDYLYRRYTGLAEPIDVCIIFSHENPTSIHPPEVCLGAGGGETQLAGDTVITGIPGMPDVRCRELAIRNAGVLNYYMYTFKFGDSYTARFGSQQAWMFLKSRMGGDGSGALIRISTPADGDIDSARARVMSFMRVAMPQIDRTLK
jgi:EpsI family protein